MLICTASQMQEIDRTAIEDYGVSGVVLMEAAGRGVVEVICSLVDPRRSNVVIICGGGNNGGDGYVVARHLIARKAKVITYLVLDRSKIVGDALINLKILEKMKADIRQLQSSADLEQQESEILRASVVVDALLGTGLNSEVRGQYRSVLEVANRSNGLKIAVDIPSGLHADNGSVLGVAFNADHTVTFAYPKLGLVTHPGVERTGKLHIVDIGIPSGIEENREFIAEFLEAESVGLRLQPRPTWGHKGTYGHLLVIAGSSGKSGAALLCGEAALRSGLGLCTIAAPLLAMQALESKIVETMLALLTPDGQELDASDAMFQHLETLWKGKAAIAIGPGIPRGPSVVNFMGRLIRESPLPIVIDADGLNDLAVQLEVLKEIRVPILLTPHPGEMARLTGISTSEIQLNRVNVAKDFAQKHGVYLALKGARTVIAGPDGRVYINPTGNTGMGSGGTGDVLTGLVGGFLAQGHDPMDSLILGVFVHGQAGDHAVQKQGGRGMLARDLLKQVGPVLKQWDFI